MLFLGSDVGVEFYWFDVSFWFVKNFLKGAVGDDSILKILSSEVGQGHVWHTG